MRNTFFSKYGIAKVVISDNGPEFTANTFQSFSKQWDFKRTTSSPHYAKSNGQIERTIQTIKKNIKKALKSNDDCYLALLAVCTSPDPENKTPPATLFYNRTIRTLLPSMDKEVCQENKKLILSNCIQHRKTLPPLKISDSVRLHDGKTWTITGKVIKKLDDIPRSYVIETSKGRLRRNRQHILLDRRKNCSKSRTIDDYDSIIVSRATDVTNNPSNTKNTSNELNDDNVNDPSPVRTRSERRVIRPIQYNDYVIS